MTHKKPKFTLLQQVRSHLDDADDLGESIECSDSEPGNPDHMGMWEGYMNLTMALAVHTQTKKDLERLEYAMATWPPPRRKPWLDSFEPGEIPDNIYKLCMEVGYNGFEYDDPAEEEE